MLAPPLETMRLPSLYAKASSRSSPETNRPTRYQPDVSQPLNRPRKCRKFTVAVISMSRPENVTQLGDPEQSISKTRLIPNSQVTTDSDTCGVLD